MWNVKTNEPGFECGLFPYGYVANSIKCFHIESNEAADIGCGEMIMIEQEIIIGPYELDLGSNYIHRRNKID